MSRSSQVVERLVLHVNNGDPESLRRELDSSERLKFSKEKVVNFPIERYNNRTVVHLAASKGQLECLILLLKSGGNPNAMSSRADLSQTPLHVAAYRSYPTCIEVLLNYGAKMGIRNSHLATPQDLATGKHKCETVFQHEIAKYRIPDRTNGENKRVQELHELISLKEDQFYILYSQLPPHHWDLATRWTDFYNQTLLYRAANEQQEHIVEFILSKSPNQPLHNLDNHRTPLIAACHRKNFQISKLLLEHSPGLIFVNEKLAKESPLHIACSHGCFDIVELILHALKLWIESSQNESSNVTLDFLDNDGQTPLYCVCKIGDYDIVKALIDFYRQNASHVSLNVNVSVKDSKRTPLQAAIQSENVDIVNILLSVKSISVNQKGRPSNETLTKLISLHQDTEVVTNQAVQKITTRRKTALTLRSNHNHDGNKHEEVRKRSQTEARTETKNDNKIGIFEHIESGELTILSTKDGQRNIKHINLNRVLISPLAEAAACANSEIIELLLLHGARDENGLACRILFSVQRPDLAKNILIYNVSCSRPPSWKKKCESAYVQLKWNKKKLSDCYAEWFEKDSVLHLNTKNLDNELIQSLSSICSISQGHNDDNNYEHFNLMPNLQHHFTLSIGSVNAILLSNNRLKCLPYQLFQLPNVQVLDVSNNLIMELPTSSSGFNGSLADQESNSVFETWCCPALKEFDISGNMLAELPNSLWQLQSLSVLNCTKNSIVKLYSDNVLSTRQSLAPNLENLNLSKNNLSGKIPDFIFQLPSLKVLDLSNNKIDELPISLWKNAILSDLNISNNFIICLPLCEPEGVYQELHCKRLKNANPFQVGTSVSRNIGEPIHSHIEPDYGEKSRSPIRKPSFTSIAVTYCYTYSALLKLNISGNKLSEFPQGLPCFAPNLQELDISNNKELKEIDIMFLPFYLKILSATKCSIKGIGNLILYKNHTQMLQNCRHQDSMGQECTHRSHSYLPYLTKLKLSGNKMVNLQLIKHHSPAENELDAIKQLVFISGKSNFDLLYPSLAVLHLASNALIGTFNPNIGHQKKLKQIDLSDNPSLEAIPMEFAYLMKKRRQELNELKLENLPHLVDPPAEYRTESLNHLLGYMKSKLKASDYYRTIKLFLVGNGERGKTTLLRRLQGFSEDRSVDRTIGIDIEPWIFPNEKSDKRRPVKFLAWDFAGQDVYHTTHQCFYSKRSLYLAVFRLSDGEAGIDELHQWLKCVNLRAPGCPVIIVGTHLDQISDQQRVKELEEEVHKRYCNNLSYPKVIEVVFINCLKKKFSLKSKVKKLRNKIYEVACHLALDGSKLIYLPTMSEDSPKALFQQKVPCAFLTLQEHIEKKVKEMTSIGLPPVMEEEEFRNTFLCAVDDEEELEEAVFFLHLQGSILHFDDHNLKHVYFLDPQWLPKMMADVIHPATKENESVAELKSLFCHRSNMSSMKDHFINYMEKFEVVLRINSEQVIIPSSMKKNQHPVPEEIQPSINCSTFCDVNGEYYPPLRRFWLSDFIPDGFWPRLTCGVLKDPQIDRILKMVVGCNKSISTSYTVTNSKSFTTLVETSSNLHINFWKKGFTFGYKDKILFIMMQDENIANEAFPAKFNEGSTILEAKFRIELHVFTNEFMSLSSHLRQSDQVSQVTASMRRISGLATKLLLLLTEHVKKLASDYFSGMIELPGTVFCSYMVCWKCLSSTSLETTPKNLNGKFIIKDGHPRSVYIVEDHICIESKKQYVNCCFHGQIPFKEQAPELIFWDLASEKGYDGNSDLDILEDEILGKGAFGVVYRGDLYFKTSQSSQELELTENVAVKLFLKCSMTQLQHLSLGQILKGLNEPTQLLNAYQEIRQEVSFISNLSHPNLTRLCGVRTNPYLCLILEMAPGKSLDIILKEYYDCGEVLEPVTLKESALQMAQGLEYLHFNQRVHLDMKSSNVLLWTFPSPHISRIDRLKRSKNVLLKIADYGISQVSIGLTSNSISAGTPGYMAPEILIGIKSRISSEKVDVFAYGMVLFELLSQSPPFQNVLDPNMEIRENIRPQIDPRKAQSPVLLQELICRCWHQDPDMRPRMEEVVKYIQYPEFDKLRDEELLENITSISSAYACRICPEQEYLVTVAETQSLSVTTKLIHNTIIPIEKIMNKDLDHIGTLDSLINKYSGRDRTHPYSSDEQSVLIGDSDDGERITSMTRFSFSESSISRHSLRQNKGPLKKKVLKSTDDNLKVKGELSDASEISATGFDPYSQIWLCSHVGRGKNILKIFTFIDDHPGHYSFSGNFPGDELTSICAVKNMMWMGTIIGGIKIFHARTLQIKFTCTLESEGISGSKPRVLKIIHVEELRSVLISTSFGDIWSFCDAIVDDCLRLQCKLSINSPCNDLLKVPLGNGQVMVYGAVDNNQIVVLEHNHESVWTERMLIIEPDKTSPTCYHIVYSHFTNSCGEDVKQIWISYKLKPILISFDILNEEHFLSLDCSLLFKDKIDQPFQITSMMCMDRKIYVGTTTGDVGVLDAENASIIQFLKCHEENIYQLLSLPSQVAPTVCVEVPFPDSTGTSTGNDGVDFENYSMIATVGSGRQTQFVNVQSRNRLSSSDQPQSQQSSDVLLQIWTI